jgi:hypothetical protein
MFRSTTETNTTAGTDAPIKGRVNNMYQTTFSGPIQKDRKFQDAARNESMAKAAYQGDSRQFMNQSGKGIRAGGKMEAYRAGVQGQAQASKAYAQAQQDTLNRLADSRAADLQFQERLAGQQGWMRDLRMDVDSVNTRMAMNAYKEFADVELAEKEREAKRIVNAANREATIMSALF